MTLTRWFRQHQRYLLAGLVILLMASWGVLGTVQSLVRDRTKESTIRGQAILPADLQDAQRALGMVLSLRLADYIMPRIMESQGAPIGARLKMEALAGDFAEFVFTGQEPKADSDSTWRYLVLLREAQAAGVQVTDGEITELLHSLPQFNDKGGFHKDVYLKLVREARATDADMARWFPQLARIAKLIAMQRQAVLVSNAELWMAYVYSYETVSIRYVAIDGAAFRPLVQPTDEELTKFYEEHRDFQSGKGPDGIGYKAPERVRAEFILVPFDQVAKQVQVPEADIAAYYKEHKQDFLVKEEAKPQPAGQQPPAPAPAAAAEKKPEPTYKPLDEVRGEITQKLAAARAKEKAGQQADAIMTDLAAVRGNYENMPQPLEQMARRHGAVFQTLKTVEGRALVTRDQLTQLVPGGEQVALFAFETQGNLYSPHKVDSGQGPVLFQVLENRQPEQQPFQDVQALVRGDCRHSLAVESARTFATKLKERADEAGLEVAAAEMTQRLANLLKSPEGKEPPVLKVQESGFFRRVAEGVPGIEGNAQDALIQAAFGLSGKQTAVATIGTPPATVCVIQASERKPAPPEGFATMDPMSRALYLYQKQRRIVQAWAQGLLEKSPSAPAAKQ